MSQATCTLCPAPTIPGLIQGAGKCQYHWNSGVWWQEWADEIRRREEEAKEDQRILELAEYYLPYD